MRKTRYAVGLEVISANWATNGLPTKTSRVSCYATQRKDSGSPTAPITLVPTDSDSNAPQPNNLPVNHLPARNSANQGRQSDPAEDEEAEDYLDGRGPCHVGVAAGKVDAGDGGGEEGG